ncbi:MAG TPA: response regulator [Caldilineaceae bacterium]|nr:response regulator [Caldilineaceae bacterium]
MSQPKQYILVIDDEPSVREVTAEILREAAVHTLEASDGPTGIEIFRNYVDQIVLVLLDYYMPDMNGIQVLEKLWHIDPSVPVLLFSGYSQHSIMRYCERDNAIGFLQKPYTINELLLAVHQNLKRV